MVSNSCIFAVEIRVVVFSHSHIDILDFFAENQGNI